MSYHSNFRQDKCWSCEFFSGQREYNHGLFGDSVHTSDKGICKCDRSQHRDKPVYEHGWCSRYQKWGVLQSTLAQKHAEQEILEMQQRAQRTSPPVKAETAAERAARIKLAKKIMKVAVIACAAMFGLGLLIGLGAYLVSVLMI